ncbi:MAG TPA: tetratricopeptide repeat protein [Gracilimonas sp.]|uniref:tetratricopeptide repeat protein n=1 Tax=Gracilimonas sp. TaxID=1974203 RepID=UPI002D8735B1|nr:tetratricopeptide repeat protein [Gracilimonas sp.]
MKKLLSNLIPVILFFGILSGCETSSPAIDQAQVNIYTQNFDSAHAGLDRFIEQNPNSGIGFYYKALAYAQEAVTVEPPSDRKPYYRDFRENIVTAREFFDAAEEKPEEAGDVSNLILNNWGREHNASLDYATNDSVMASVEEPLKIAASHLENAIIINPDSTLSYDVLSQIHFMDNNYESAAEVLSQSMELKDPPPADDYDRLGAFYTQLGETEKAIDVLKEGLELYPDSVSLTQKLADNYMTAGERELAIEVLEDLIETEPQNPQYHLALGTIVLTETDSFTGQISDLYDEIYDLKSELRNASGSKAEDLRSQIESLEQEINKNIDQIQRLNDIAEQELLRTIELRADDAIAYNALGVLYNNKAAILFGQRNYSDDMDLVDQYDTQAKEQLTKAMENYEKAVELNPDNTSAWRSLSSIYITLDMQEKAEEALDKAGM